MEKNILVIHENLESLSIAKIMELVWDGRISQTNTWMTSATEYIMSNQFLQGNKMKLKIRRQTFSYVIIMNQLYYKRFPKLLLKSLMKEEYGYFHEDIHEGTVGQHLGVRDLEKESIEGRILLVGDEQRHNGPSEEK